MKANITAPACVAALVGLTALVSSPALAQENIKIVYEQPKKAEFGAILDRLRKRKVLETLQQFLSPLKFPLTVRTAECGAYYAPYKHGGPVTICYEFVDLIESVLPGEKGVRSPDPNLQDMFKTLGRIGPNLITREMATVGPFVEHVLHETALAVFDNLEVPVWGRLHDAADYSAAFLLFQFGTDIARQTIFGTAYFLNQWDTVIREGQITDENYLGDIRPTVRQRYYNLLCIAVGKDPIGFSSFIAVGRPNTPIDLPTHRIAHCRGSLTGQASYTSDYEKVRRAFTTQILPYVDREKLKKVQGTKWLPD
jgi:Putative metallopeptidase